MERYESYKDSGVEWIGVIPEKWKLVNLGALVSQRKRPNKGLQNENVLSLSYGEIKRRILDNSGLLPASFEDYNIIEKNDIVLRLTDLQNDQKSLRVGLSNEKGIITSAYVTVIPLNIEPSFLFYLLASFDYWKGFYGLAGGVRQSLNFKGIRSLRFPLAPINEQKLIVDYLESATSQIDSLIEKNKKSIELLEEYRKSVISEAVTKGLDPDVPMKDSGVEWIGEIPEGWRTVPFLRFFSLRKGLAITKANLVESGVPVINYGQIHSKTNPGTKTVHDLLRFISESDNAISESSPTAVGDIVFADTSEDKEGCGNCFYIGQPNIYAGYHTFIAHPKNHNYSKYLSYLFQTDEWRSQVRSRVSGVKVYSLTRRVLGVNTILIPSSNSMNDIVNYLDAKTIQIDSLIDKKKQLIEKLQEYRKSLISECVTGKIKVPGVE